MNTMSGHRENGARDWYCHEGLTWSFISSSKFGIRFLPSGYFLMWLVLRFSQEKIIGIILK